MQCEKTRNLHLASCFILTQKSRVLVRFLLNDLLVSQSLVKYVHLQKILPECMNRIVLIDMRGVYKSLTVKSSSELCEHEKIESWLLLVELLRNEVVEDEVVKIFLSDAHGESQFHQLSAHVLLHGSHVVLLVLPELLQTQSRNNQSVVLRGFCTAKKDCTLLLKLRLLLLEAGTPRIFFFLIHQENFPCCYT